MDTKKVKPNLWNDHVRAYAKKHNLQWKEALKAAGPSWEKFKKKTQHDAEMKELDRQIASGLPNFEPRTIAPPSVRKFLENNGEAKIVRLRVCRKPIFKIIQRAINLIRRLVATSNKPWYDKLFHLYALVELDNGVKFMMERNQVFNIQMGIDDKGGECIDIGTPTMTFGEIMDKAVAANGDQNFWIYDAIKNNCQDMIISFLKAGGVLTKENAAFVKQDTKDLLPDIVGKVARKVTDIAAGADKIVNGEGK